MAEKPGHGDCMRVATLGLAALVLLSGCTGGGRGADPADADFSDLDIAPPTETTGIVRGVVVDDAVRPVAGAEVTLRGPGGALPPTRTTEEGLFGFGGLEPGTYFLTASKPGFSDSQQSVEVIAGVAEPPIVRVLLAADPEDRPYFEAHTFDGFLECGVTTPFVGVALCLAPNLLLGTNVTTDRTQVTYAVSRAPDWVQTEMVWQSTQQAGGELALMYSWNGDCGLLCDHEVEGRSPLLLQANRTVIDAMGLGNGTGLYVRVFNDDMEETDAGIRVCTPVEDPVLGVTWCTSNGVGLTLEQRFQHYTHVFYGYTPPEGWRFTAGQGVPAPPA